LQAEEISFDRLPFSDLFRTYVSDFPKLAAYYSANPFEPESIANHADAVRFRGDRDKAANLLIPFNERFGAEEPAFENIDLLRSDDALAVVTGQQLGIYGGPLYTVLKIITTIHLSRTLTSRLDRPVVPVFWLADEDHDFQEIRNVKLLDRDEVVTIGLESSNGSRPVADIELSEDFESFRNRVEEGLFSTDFTDRLWHLLDTAYTEGSTMGEAFGRLIADLFSGSGLVLAGSNWKPIKEEARDCMKVAVSHADQIRELLEEQSASLEEEFHRQATLYDSNLFYLTEDRGRTKIVRDGKRWKTDTGKSWSADELMDEIDSYPERFSPNVFLRPILQDLLVPTLGYVGGPGEVAYYGQMKSMYPVFKRRMPLIFPRLSATLIEPAVARILEELPFDVPDYDKRIEDLESEFVERAEQHDIEAIFEEWKSKVDEVSKLKTEEIKEIDPTLEGAAGKATAVYEGELDKLKGKVYRSVKQQEQTQLKRIRKIKANLFPEGALQERTVSFIYFMNKYGLDIWERLLEQLEEGEAFDHHKLIYL